MRGRGGGSARGMRRACAAGDNSMVWASEQGALVAALALSLVPDGDAFLSTPAALRTPALRHTASRPARRDATAPRMSDLSDMTLEMLKRVEKQLDGLDDVTLARVRRHCARLSAPASRPPPPRGAPHDVRLSPAA
jgi:hypothetical protein